MCVSGGKKCSFFGKLGVLCFLVTSVLRFDLLPYYRRIFHSQLGLVVKVCFRYWANLSKCIRMCMWRSINVAFFIWTFILLKKTRVFTQKSSLFSVNMDRMFIRCYRLMSLFNGASFKTWIQLVNEEAAIQRCSVRKGVL